MIINKTNLLKEFKQFKQKQSSTRYSFKTGRILKQRNLDTSLSEQSSLITNTSSLQLPSDLLFYQDLKNLKTLFKINLDKIITLMKK